MSIEQHRCIELNKANQVLGDRIEIFELEGIYNMEVSINRFDSNYGEIEENEFIPVNFCPFCGTYLTITDKNSRNVKGEV